MIKIIAAATAAGNNIITGLSNRFQPADNSCRDTVTAIIADVRENGDAALVKYNREFDAPGFNAGMLPVGEEEIRQAKNAVNPDFLKSLTLAAGRIEEFHREEREKSWFKTRADGVITGRIVRPVDAAGLYVPGGRGGTTPLVSSVLMNGIPAGIAGVPRRVMLTPPDREGRVNPALLVAADHIGIHEIYKAGSAWAIAALALGTESIAPVDVIVGPGNQFVTEAKRQVAGRVGIDMIAGPSEILIVADGNADPAYIAADMLAQAEHDPLALAMLVCLSRKTGEETIIELEKQLPRLKRQEIARQSLADRGVILVEPDLDQALELANTIGAEHLELMIADPFAVLGKIRHAGAIFLGGQAPESTGDYVAGPNHVLPTMGTARFSSALGVETFVKKSSLIAYTREGMKNDSDHIQLLANLEGLSAHARSAAIRSD